MNHYLVIGDKPGYSDRFDIWGNSREEAERTVISFGYSNVKAFDWDLQYRCRW